MSCLCAPALRRLQSEINDKWPDRDRSSDGCCGDSAHAARKSDHNSDATGYAHALDIDENLAPSPDPKPLLWLVPVLLRDSRTKYVIYEKRIYYAACKTHGAACFVTDGHAYDGINAHDKHLHVSITATATFETRSWLATVPAAPPEEEDMPPAPAPAIAVVNGVRFAFVLADAGIWWNQSDQPDPKGWTRIPGGILTSSPAAVATSDGTIEVVARGADGATWSTKRLPIGGWTTWKSLGGRS